MLVVLFGLEGSGKTYVGKRLSENSSFHFLDADEALTEEMKICIAEKRSVTQAMRNRYFNVVIEKIELLCKEHDNVIVSQAFYKNINREQISSKFSDCIFLQVTVDLTTLSERLRIRNDTVDEEYVARMSSNFERPTHPYYIIYNDLENNALSLIEQFMKIPKLAMIMAGNETLGLKNQSGSDQFPTTSDDKLFCFFSGFAQRNIELRKYQNDVERGVVLLSCKNHSEHFLWVGDYIQLDGVLFEIVETFGSFFKASSTINLIENTSIEKACPGDILTLGILAEKDVTHDCMWMLQPSASSKVTYNNYSVLENHEHTLKLDFEALTDKTPFLQEGCHLGLAGSSLTAREVVKESHLTKFSIYCGKETREKSQFNQDLPQGISINLTEPAEIENRLEI